VEQFFDDLARASARSTSRRQALRAMLAISVAALTGSSCPHEPCEECEGNDGMCYTCSEGTRCSTSGGSNCSSPKGGVYCCGDTSSSSSCRCNPGSTYNFSSQTCCRNATPYYFPGGRGYGAGCYASCPYVNDCGSRFQRC
jgi:hypothetical protein